MWRELGTGIKDHECPMRTITRQVYRNCKRVIVSLKLSEVAGAKCTKVNFLCNQILYLQIRNLSWSPTRKPRSSIPLLWGGGLQNVVCGHVAQVMTLRIMQTSPIYPWGGNGANAADNNGNRICNGCAVPRRMIVPTLYPRRSQNTFACCCPCTH